MEDQLTMTGGAILGFALLFLPAIIAVIRKHRNAAAICVLTICAVLITAFVPLLGFLPGVGMWIGAIVWASTANTNGPRGQVAAD